MDKSPITIDSDQQTIRIINLKQKEVAKALDNYGNSRE